MNFLIFCMGIFALAGAGAVIVVIIDYIKELRK